MMLIIYWESWPTSQVYGEKEVQVDAEAIGKLSIYEEKAK